MVDFLRQHGKTIALVLSLILNALGGTGTIPPPVQLNAQE